MSQAATDERVKTLLMEALERGPSERAGFLSGAVDDPFIRAEVLSLIEAHEQAGDFLDDPSAGAEAAAAAARRLTNTQDTGITIGRYKLLQLIGEGGFGSVYMAEQREPVV